MGLSTWSRLSRMSFRRWEWPLMWRSTHEATRRENIMLRQVCLDTQRELRKHKDLLAGIKAGTIDIVAVLEKMTTQKKF